MVAAFDEMQGHDGAVRPAYGELARWLADLPPDVLDYRRREAELIFRRIGITFAVYGEADAQERLRSARAAGVSQSGRIPVFPATDRDPRRRGCAAATVPIRGPRRVSV